MPSMFLDGSRSSEEGTERPNSAMSGLSTRKSEVDFEKIDAESGTEEVENGRQTVKRGQSSSGSWLSWSWGAKTEIYTASVDTAMAGTVGEDKGKSSAIDTCLLD